MLKKFFCIFLCILILAFPVSVSAKNKRPPLELSAPSAVLIESDTGKILFEKNKNEKRACASITKVMTLLLVMEALEQGKLSLSQTLSASAHAASMGGSDIWLEENEKMSVDDLIKATAVASANDAAVVLAEAISGSEEAFVAQMNKRAQELGMKNTTFKNCNGLDEKGHLTSAYDVALMSRELIKYPKIFDYTSIWIDELRGGKTQIVNTNKLLKTYDGITGLKTGTTSEAGCCMSATAERDGLSIIAVVLGCDNGKERFKDAAKLLDYGFANYMLQSTKLPKGAKGSIEVEGGMSDNVELVCENPGNLVIGRMASDKILSECSVKTKVKAPVRAGEKLGYVNYYSDGELLKSCPVTAKTSVEKMTFKSIFRSMLNSILEL